MDKKKRSNSRVYGKRDNPTQLLILDIDCSYYRLIFKIVINQRKISSILVGRQRIVTVCLMTGVQYTGRPLKYTCDWFTKRDPNVKNFQEISRQSDTEDSEKMGINWDISGGIELNWIWEPSFCWKWRKKTNALQ